MNQGLKNIVKASKRIAKNNKWYIIITLLSAGWFTLWAWHIGYNLNGGPDESMRYLVPSYIYEYNKLPTGYDKEAIFQIGNWSYAFYPQLLGSLISALFMKIMALFNSGEWAVLFAARIASVLFAAIAVFFVGKTTQLLSIGKSRRYYRYFPYVAMILFAMWPQFSFLAGYVNNDIVAAAGVSVIVYACTRAYRKGWTIASTAWFAIGSVVCLLGYGNSYGFVLFGGIFFLTSQFIAKRKLIEILKLSSIAAAIVIVFAAPFYIRNAIIYDGDLTGMQTFNERQTEWENQNNYDMQKSYSDVTGFGKKHILIDSEYKEIQYESFIARFGAMSIAPTQDYVSVYKLLINIISLSTLWIAVAGFINYQRSRKNQNSESNRINPVGIMYGLFITASCIVTVGSSVYYTLFIDYQPQGRYVIYLLIPIMTIGIYFAHIAINKLINNTYINMLVLLATIIYCWYSVNIFLTYILPLK